ncbi:hypothetical protein BXZ70DRAFT_337884 [Cristinia sonorae]|uniref:Long chronological lifespan protein 2 n=1 Tax=Cristinia sonorae TaxID=1940300 RepID=A0A8K0UKY9_9AGAR|nr:hypothetical protein BXZ70DRAFT_337884 [Cristinia sonorae]
MHNFSTWSWSSGTPSSTALFGLIYPLTTWHSFHNRSQSVHNLVRRAPRTSRSQICCCTVFGSSCLCHSYHLHRHNSSSLSRCLAKRHQDTTSDHPPATQGSGLRKPMQVCRICTILTVELLCLLILLYLVSLLVPCSEYLCPKTLTCVSNPAQCPCPDAQDIKCIIPDLADKDAGTVVCVRGGSDCSVVERLAGK